MPDPEFPLDWLVAANRLALIATQLSNVIHETNNILQIISGNAELIAIAGVSPPVDSRARAIADQTERASELLGEVLAFARDVSSTTERVDVKTIVDRAVTLRRYSLSKARISIVIEGEGEYLVIGNRQQLLQSVLVVLMNAEQALARGSERRITVQFRAESETVTVSVTDNASCQAPLASHEAEGRRPMWNPAEPLRLGIGLTVARHLLAQQGGSIALNPATPRGTTVVLTLRRSL